ncbi:PEHE domain-containing protein [Mycena sanguinolenta]|uniref:PEHE domain-containing protein n=1 Tax=Mycena sanguinolenta TaxID=230812 RepID=A0A8H6XA59_9AGAR|nr:PEHE domain-containing protein [Mycena sanguinolenta]
MDNDATLAHSSSHLPQRRVLPSRLRRGGPGVGGEVDLLIWNAQSSKLENEPLVPADTPFVLKTNDKLEQAAAEFSSVLGSGLNNKRAYESYFDRPEVLKSYREQTIIETPEFTDIADVPSVGGRLRVRTTEENNADLDAVYEKRHKKYEKFEKGQRLREKEKLKHAQYKLKERIEQLRGMDNSAFMAVPASLFSDPPVVPEVMEDDPILGGMNGNPAYLEGERRRKEMLMNAQALEERYRILLPPDRQKKPAGQAGINQANDLDSELSGKEFVRHDEESEIDEDVNKKESQKLKLKLPARPNIASSPKTVPSPKAPPPASKKRSQPPKPPAPRKSKPPMPTSATPQIPSMGEPGPSSLTEPLDPNFEPVAHTPLPPQEMEPIMTSLRFMQYEPSPSSTAQRPKRKRQKTDAHDVASSPAPLVPHADYSVLHPPHADYSVPRPHPDYSAPHPEDGDYSPHAEQYDERMLMSPRHSSPHMHEPPLTYSFPPPPPPPGDEYPSPDTTIPPADSVSQGPVSPIESDPNPNDFSNDFSANEFSAPLHPPTPPAEGAPVSVPPVAKERSPSVPPIESISAPVTTAGRRGRRRGTVVAQPVVRRKPAVRRPPPPCYLITYAERKSKSSRSAHNRPNEAFGVKLPSIIQGSDSYDFELPEEIRQKDKADWNHDAEVTQDGEENNGSEDEDEGEDEDEDGPEPEEGQDSDLDSPEDEDSDGGT